MSDRSIIRDAVRRIQDVITSTLGRTLPGEAETRLEYILQSVATNRVASIGESYSQREVTILLADLSIALRDGLVRTIDYFRALAN